MAIGVGRGHSTHRPTHGSGGGGGNGGGMNDNQQSAFDLFMSIMESYGFTDVGEIAKVVKKAILDGITDSAQLDLMVRDTSEWHKRFAGNDLLTQSGGNALSVAEYLSVETSMAQVMKQAGLPPGFYDQPSDFAKFIGNNVSAAELQGRVSEATDLMNRNDNTISAQLASMGMSQGDLLAYYLDPSKAAPILTQKYQTALIGAAARKAGLTANNDYAAQLASQGVSESQAIQGYGTIADIAPKLNQLGDIYGVDYGQADAEAEVFGAGTSDKRRKLSSAERGAFTGSSGTGQSSLGKSSTGSY